MSRPIPFGTFGHHVWASLRVIDACIPLTAEQLPTRIQSNLRRSNS